ncbi:probable OTU1 Yeast OTU Deubiquitinating enzyme 1 [Rhynchosporium secalis]|uniref:Ubiquitin thioesterase OTU n=1 Tax=Rhynchosporium secalis TaxID=38038 RepID=A0A1E1MW12_RHYSE|nr:probable OTU1 Yeast OTU Deubiquitinating enzyme 1 [Rhynchosporium secalis]
MRTRVRAPAGAFIITLPDDATVGDLVAQITEKTSFTSFDVKHDFPPKSLLLEGRDKALPLSELGVKLDGEQLIISPKDDGPIEEETKVTGVPSAQKATQGLDGTGSASLKEHKPVSLQRKGMVGDVPEVYLPGRGTTVVLRVMPDDNSCLFRAFGTAVLPGDDQSMTELRSIIATAIHSQPETYSKVVLEQEPDDYCRWIQTPDAWGGAIEMGIMAKYFDVEICSIDVQSLRIDKFNEEAQRRCILVYSGIHYDTIAESAISTDPEFDTKIWETDDDQMLEGAVALCKELKEKHYFTDTGGMAIKCNECGIIVYGEGQAAGHATQFGHFDMNEIAT